MITQNMPKYGGYVGDDTYFIIGSSWEEIDKELEGFIKEHGTKDNTIWIYREPGPKPSKVNLRPEYTMEVSIIDKSRGPLLMFGQTCVWRGDEQNV